MPEANHTEIAALISKGQIAAISLDTSIFDKAQLNLRSSALLSLSQFQGTSIRVLISEIVSSEVRNHLVSAASEARVKLHAALRDARKATMTSMVPSELDHILGIGGDLRSLSEQSFHEYMEAINAIEVHADGLVSTQEILAKYFCSEPPFSNKADKKNEFPDAYALLSLEAWSRKNRCLTLIVSRDNDWKNFCEGSDYLFCLGDLPEALNLFNQQGRFYIERVLAYASQNAHSTLVVELNKAISELVETFEPHVEAWSAMEYDLDYIECAVKEWSFADRHQFNIISADLEYVVFSLELSITANFDATFNLSVYDGIDREYISMGSNTVGQEKTFTTAVAVKVLRSDKSDIDVDEIELIEPLITIYFGDVDPDWSDDR